MDRANSLIYMLKMFGRDILTENESKIVATLKDLQISKKDVSIITSILEIDRRSFLEFLGESDNNNIMQFVLELSESTGYKYELIYSVIEDFNHAWWYTQYIKPSCKFDNVEYGIEGDHMFYNHYEDEVEDSYSELELCIYDDSINYYAANAVLLDNELVQVDNVFCRTYANNKRQLCRSTVYIPKNVHNVYELPDLASSFELHIGNESYSPLSYYIVDPDNPYLYSINGKIFTR